MKLHPESPLKSHGSLGSSHSFQSAPDEQRV
jgi:hypothetical protein